VTPLERWRAVPAEARRRLVLSLEASESAVRYALSKGCSLDRDCESANADAYRAAAALLRSLSSLGDAEGEK